MSWVCPRPWRQSRISPSRWEGCSRAESGQAGKRQAVLIGWLASLLSGLSPLAAPPALLLGALSLFNTAPAQAQNNPVWSATLTVNEAFTNSYGCHRFASADSHKCPNAMTQHTFTLDGTAYPIRILALKSLSGGKWLLELEFSVNPPTSIEGTTWEHVIFRIAGQDFRPTSASGSAEDGYSWIINSGSTAHTAFTTAATISVQLIDSRVTHTTSPETGVELESAAFLPGAGGPDLVIPEGGSATFGVRLSERPTATVTVNLGKIVAQPLDATPDEFYASVDAVNAVTVSPTTLTFTPGNYSTLQTVTVTGVQAYADGAHEHVIVSVQRASGGFWADGVYVTVTDDGGGAVQVGVQPAIVRETDNQLITEYEITFWLSRAASSQVTVDVDLGVGGTATEGLDFDWTVSTVTFAPGETRKTVKFPVYDDNVEDSGETFFVELSNPQGATIAPGYNRARVEIRNDEAHLDGLTVESAASIDGPFTALDMGGFAAETTDYAVTVPYGTTHARLAPTADEDLTLSAGSGTELTRVRSGEAGPAMALEVGDNVLVVKVVAGTDVEETYRVTVTRQQSTGTTTDTPTTTTSSSDSASVSLLATPNPVGEGSPVTVMATLSEALSEAVTIPLTVTRGTAESGDHGSLASITLPAGFTSATGTLPTFGDDDGDDETFTLSLGSLPAGLTAGSASSVEVTITDSGLSAEGDTTTSSSGGPSPTASGPDGETLLVGFGQIAQTPPEVSITALDGSSTISEGEMARFVLTADPAPSAGESITVAVAIDDRGEFVSSGQPNPRMVTIGEDGTADFSVATQDDDMDEPNGSITATVTTGTGYNLSDSDNTAEVEVRDDDAPVAAPPTEEKRAWHIRFGRTISQQVVDALQQRFSTSSSTPSGLQLTVAGETVTGDTPLEENHVLLSRLLGFERVSGQELTQGSSFSFSPEGAGARLSFWGKGAFSSFDGVEESITLTGDVTTALVGAEWSRERWQAGAALSHSWGSGSYQGEGDGADGRISSSLTGIFPYGRYALTPRLGVWATAGYGWGSLSLNPDGDGSEYNPATTLALGAVGMDGLLLDGGSEGITLTTTADALFLKTTSEAVEGLASSEGNITRLRLGLEATRPFPLSNGASLSPSLEVGLRQDSGDAETGFGMDLGAGLSWNDPEQGITAAVKGRTLLSHGAEHFQDQGLALSFSWEPDSSNRGPSLSLSHAVGLPAEGGMAALLNPTAIEVLDEPNSSGERFEARLAYGFPFYNDRLTLSPSLATALSNNSRSYSLLWSLAPYDEHLMEEPWQLSLEGERHENLSSSSTVDHSLKLRFALPL